VYGVSHGSRPKRDWKVIITFSGGSPSAETSSRVVSRQRCG
jgi:hypothetical protein